MIVITVIFLCNLSQHTSRISYNDCIFLYITSNNTSSSYDRIISDSNTRKNNSTSP